MGHVQGRRTIGPRRKKRRPSSATPAGARQRTVSAGLLFADVGGRVVVFCRDGQSCVVLPECEPAASGMHRE